MKNANVSKFFLCAIVTVLAAAIPPVQADYTWTGAVDDNWGTSGNWTYNGTDNGRFRVSSTTVGGIKVTDTQQPSPAATLYMQNPLQETITVTPSGSLTLQNLVMAWNNSTSDSTFIVDGGYLRSNNSLDIRLQNTEQASFEVRNGGTASIGGRLFGVDNPPAGANATVTVDGAGSTLTFGGNWEGYDNIDLTLLAGGSLSVAGAMTYEGTAVTVGVDSTFELGNAAHIFTNGLTIDDGGTLSAGDNSSAPLTSIAGALTLLDGAVIDYSINGAEGTSDEWDVTSLTLNSTASYSLIVDVVAGDVKQSAGPWMVFDAAAPIINFVESNWTITTAEGTRLSSTGTLSIDGSGDLVLTGFEAFSIPEPSTGLLLGLGAMVMILRRRVLR